MQPRATRIECSERQISEVEARGAEPATGDTTVRKCQGTSSGDTSPPRRHGVMQFGRSVPEAADGHRSPALKQEAEALGLVP